MATALTFAHYPLVYREKSKRRKGKEERLSPKRGGGEEKKEGKKGSTP